MAEPIISRVECPSPEAFQREFLAAERPVILAGLTRRWRAVGRWTLEYFKAKIPDLSVRYELWESDPDSEEDVSSYTRQRVFRWAPMAEFVDLLQQSSGRSMYSTNFPIFDFAPELSSDIEPLDRYMAIPRWLPEVVRRIFQVEPYLWTGPAGAVTLLHFDR